MLKVLVSNRMEVLARALAERLKDEPLSDAAAREVILIPSRGMETWLSMKISEVLGISANLGFSFPAREVRKILTAALATLDPNAAAGDDEDPWDPDRLAWTLLSEIPGRLADPRFAALAGYLSGDDAPAPGSPIRRKEYSLVTRIANLLDEYANYRPDWVRAWSAPGAGDHPESLPGVDAGNAWQPLLWIAAQERLGRHPLSRLDEATAVLADPSGKLEGLPPRLAVFGISTLPPVFLRVLVALARHIEVTVYALSPVKDYYGHVRTRRERIRLMEETPDADPADLHFDNAPLVESMGKLGRDFNEILAGLAGADPTDRCEDPNPRADGRETMLSLLQSDLLNLRDAGGTGSGVDAHPIHAPDGSIRFHACHGALRQVEVLRDELLRLFRGNPELQPRDVVVMCPDIDAYAPLIDAVFADGDRDEKPDDENRAGFPEMRFAVADRNARGLNPVAEAVSQVLDLAVGRLPASQIVDLLSLGPVQRKFDLADGDLERIRLWVAESRARWGLDETHREAESQPKDRQNTWRFALDRLLLGTAMPGEGRRFFEEVLPYDEVEGGTARDLGKFMRFCETLFEVRRFLAGGAEGRVTATAIHRTAAEWRVLVGDLVDTFTKVSESRYWQSRKVREAMKALEEEAGAAELGRPLDLETVRLFLDERLAAGGSTSGLLKGGINFCALVPMRSIPFQVVCLLGMDDGAFPRQLRRAGFDLIARDPRPKAGDRNPRDDDRYLFLEALVSARDAVIVVWNGRGIRDNAELPPAVPVGELLDACARSFAVHGKTFDDLREDLIQVHPLQAFSPGAFDPERPEVRSFSRRNLKGARALLQPKGPPWEFFDTEILSAPDEWIARVDDLASFFEHPAKFLATRRLGIRLDARDHDVEDREPVDTNALEDWAIGDQVLRALVAGDPADVARKRVRFEGRLPMGTPADVTLDEIEGAAREVVEQVRSLPLGEPRRTLAQGSFGSRALRLEGSLDGMFEGGQLALLYSKIKAKRVLAAWVRHLVACATVPDFSGTTWLVGRLSASSGFPSTCLFQGVPGDGDSLVDRARSRLEDLLDLYVLGWSQPLLLMPDSTWKYAWKLRTAKKPEEAEAQARGEASKAFLANLKQGYPNEERDLYWAWILSGRNPWEAGAELDLPGMTDELRPEVLAKRVWNPVMEALAAGSKGEGTP